MKGKGLSQTLISKKKLFSRHKCGPQESFISSAHTTHSPHYTRSPHVLHSSSSPSECCPGPGSRPPSEPYADSQSEGVPSRLLRFGESGLNSAADGFSLGSGASGPLTGTGGSSSGSTDSALRWASSCFLFLPRSIFPAQFAFLDGSWPLWPRTEVSGSGTADT